MGDSPVSPLHDSQVHGVAVSDSSDPLDRLSELPNSLILVILSLLPIMEVVRTTLLSKRWKDLWSFVPCLDFQNHQTLNDDFDKFRNFLFGALVNWKGPKILKFRIDFPFCTSRTMSIDSLLLFAILKQAEELSVELTDCESFFDECTINYSAPRSLYSCAFVKKLRLVSVKLDVDERVKWDKLKSLTIEGTDSLTEEGVNRILVGAPSLEVLSLRIKENSENLNIRSSGLKMLKIAMYGPSVNVIEEDETVLGIWAPNLEILEISGVSYSRCSINVPSLIKASLCFDERDHFMDDPRFLMFMEMLKNLVQSISHVENLVLTDFCVKLLLNMKENDVVVQFLNTKLLKLHNTEVDEIHNVLEMFPELMMLIIEHDGNELLTSSRDEEPFFDTEFDTCKSLVPKTITPSLSMFHLKRVEITWPMPEKSDTSIFPVIEMLLESCHVLEKMVLRLRMGEAANPEMFVLAEENVLSMARCSPTAEVIISRC